MRFFSLKRNDYFIKNANECEIIHSGLVEDMVICVNE